MCQYNSQLSVFLYNDFTGFPEPFSVAGTGNGFRCVHSVLLYHEIRETNAYICKKECCLCYTVTGVQARLKLEAFLPGFQTAEHGLNGADTLT